METQPTPAHGGSESRGDDEAGATDGADDEAAVGGDERVGSEAAVVDGERADVEPDPQAVLDALYDRDCRAILDAVADGPRTAAELPEACDLPLSTTYRKVAVVAEASLVREHTRIEDDGNHASQYRRSFEDLVVRVTGDGTPEVDLVRPDDWPRLPA